MPERLQLEKALEYIREDDGDICVVTKLDRFARNLEEAHSKSELPQKVRP